MFTDIYVSPIGQLIITASTAGIESISFSDKEIEINKNEHTEAATQQLQLYFDGKLEVFTLQLTPQGTEFQKKVWELLLTVNFAKTKSYLQQARAYGDTKAIRAVASANGKNPIAIVIPCHRIVGTNGSLTGYAGELWRKKWLLEHELKVAQKIESPTLF